MASTEKKAVVLSIGKPFEKLTELACDGGTYPITGNQLTKS